MVLLSDMSFDLPLQNPVIIFSLVLFIILFAPIIFNKIRVPHIIGLILAGVIIGPYGLNLLKRDSSMVLFGTVGLLYIMFTAGLEIDLEEFKKNRVKSLVFGLYTFIIPISLGSVAAYYVLDFNLASAILLASMFASHTLLAYPITSRYGVNRIRSVTLTIGGTIITDILALVVLAAIVGMYKGEIGSAFWIRLAVSSAIFAGIVIFIFPIVARWFFKRFDDNISQYIFVLAMVFLGSFLAEAAGLEAIIGAFLSGLALNRFIPHTSPLMNRIEFVGNAIFIPFFLIGVGMLVDFSVLFKGLGALKVAGLMTVMAVVTKYLAALATQKTFRLNGTERQMIFGLSNARVGATLAVVLVGYNVILGETPAGDPIRLLNEDVLNGTILMILVTCTISSLTVEKASRKMALLEGAQQDTAGDESSERILIPLAYPDTVGDLVDLATILTPHKSGNPIYALHVRNEGEEPDRAPVEGKKMLESAVRQGTATDHTILPLTRFDLNISNGIIYTIREYSITHVIIGLHKGGSDKDNLFGTVTGKILDRTREAIYIYKAVQPLNTLRRIVVAVPANAEYEEGFRQWFQTIRVIARATGQPVTIFGTETTVGVMSAINEQQQPALKIQFQPFDDWSEFLVFTSELRPDDLFIVVASRKGYLSYHPESEKLPKQLTRHFSRNSFIILYPEQRDDLQAPGLKPVEENRYLLDKAGNFVRKIFTGK